MEVNMIGTTNVPRAAKDVGGKDRIVEFTTSEVFGSMAPPWLDVTEVLKTDELSVLKLSSLTHDPTVELGCIQRSHPAWDVTRVSWRSGRSAEGLA